MKNPFGSVVNFVKHAAAFVSNAFIILFGHDKAAAFGHAAADVLETSAGKIVASAVAAVENASPALDGKTKFAQAFAAVESTFKTQGISATTSVINLLIELAVSGLNGYFSKDVPQPTEPASTPVVAEVPVESK